MTRLRTARMLVVVAVSITAGVASASAVIPQGGDSGGGPDSLTPDASPASVESTTPDPAGGPDWAVRVYRSLTGETCPEAGRTSGGQFGRIEAGRFTVLPVEPSGSCSDLGANLAAFAVNRYPATPDEGARIAIFGVASPHVQTVALKTGASEQPLALDNRSFLVVRAATTLDGLALVFTTDAGASVEHQLAPPAGG
jgi:hypothetical protein